MAKATSEDEDDRPVGTPDPGSVTRGDDDGAGENAETDELAEHEDDAGEEDDEVAENEDDAGEEDAEDDHGDEISK